MKPLPRFSTWASVPFRAGLHDADTDAGGILRGGYVKRAVQSRAAIRVTATKRVRPAITVGTANKC